MRIKFLLATLLILSLSACSLSTPTAQLPTLAVPTETAPALPTDTAIPPTDAPTQEPTAEPTLEPTLIPGTQVEFNGISFRLPAGVASTITGQVIPAVTGADLPFFALNPPQIEISLTDYVLADRFHQPRVIVSPIAGYEARGSVFTDRFNELRTVLADRPADAEHLPFMPMFNAAQVFHTAPVYLDFQNGSGVRYLTQFDQAFMPITNHSLFYTFQGITADGVYHVALILPISHPFLPEDESDVSDWSAFAENFPSYIGVVRASLEAFPPAEFTPNLADLDALAASLLVQP